jgi:hypothetical protein
MEDSRYCAPLAPGRAPRDTSGCPMRVSGVEANRISQLRMNSLPIPRVRPSIMAMVVWERSVRRRTEAAKMSRSGSTGSCAGRWLATYLYGH